ncbi:unnamed protein product, partial [Prorocentrum cordatum]
VSSRCPAASGAPPASPRGTRGRGRRVGLWRFGPREVGAMAPAASLATAHGHNIFDAQLARCQRKVISCGADGFVCLTEVESTSQSSQLLFQPEPFMGCYQAFKVRPPGARPPRRHRRARRGADLPRGVAEERLAAGRRRERPVPEALRPPGPAERARGRAPAHA